MINRREFVSSLLANRRDILVVAGLGSPVYDVFEAGDHPLNFYNWGAMGSATMVGLGLALSQPNRPVVVFTGDGEMLMGLGAFATIAQHKPKNLTIVILDNEQYAETGMQDTATAYGADLASVARGCGLSNVSVVSDQDANKAIRADIDAMQETTVVVAKIERGDVPRTLPIKDGVEIKSRFVAALGV